MSSASGVGNAKVNLQIQQMLINEDASETAMEETKGRDKASRMDAAEAMQGIHVPGAVDDNGAVMLTSFNGPEIKSDYEPDLNKADEFLGSESYALGDEEGKERMFGTTKLFSDQAVLLLQLQRAFRQASNDQAKISGSLSQLNSLITTQMADRMVDKARARFSQELAGNVVSASMSMTALGGAGKNSRQARAETKDHNVNMGNNRAAQREQMDALKTMERDGQKGTPEHQDLENRLTTTQDQGKDLMEQHELERSKTDHRHGAFMALQGMGQLAGGTISGGAGMTDAAGQADITRQETARGMFDDMKRRSDEGIKQLNNEINDAIRSIRDIEAASTDVITSVARNI